MSADELTSDDKTLIVLVFGFARGAALALKRDFPLTPDGEMRILRRLGVRNPEQYLSDTERSHLTTDMQS